MAPTKIIVAVKPGSNDEHELMMTHFRNWKTKKDVNDFDAVMINANPINKEFNWYSFNFFRSKIARREYSKISASYKCLVKERTDIPQEIREYYLSPKQISFDDYLNN